VNFRAFIIRLISLRLLRPTGASRPIGEKLIGSAMDVEGILAGVRGAIGLSLEEINRSQAQAQASGGSLAPSSLFDDDSVYGSEDDGGYLENKASTGAAANKNRKGLPPIAPVTSKARDLSEDFLSSLSAEDQKRIKR